MNSSLLYHAFGVSEYNYSGTEYKDSSIFFKLKNEEPKKLCCPKCGSTEVIRYGKIHRDIRNLPIGKKHTFLSLTIQRYHCKKCEHTYQADIPFTHGGVSYTYRFSRYVLELLRVGGTISSVAKHLGVNWNIVKEIHKKYLRYHYTYPDLSRVKRIGIDEFAVRKGHVYKTIVVDLDTGAILYVGNGKGADSLNGWWKRCRRNKVNIQVVTSDLSAAFISSVMENAPEAVHIYDRFHIVQLVTDAVDEVRRGLWNQEKDLEKRKLIKGSRWLLLRKDSDKFDGEHKTRLQNILKTNEALSVAYYLKEDLQQIWQQSNKEEGEKQLSYWCDRAKESKLAPFVKAANTLLSRRSGILAWYDHHVTNAMVEGINNKIKVLKRKAYGYRDDEYFDLLLKGLHDSTVTNAKNG